MTKNDDVDICRVHGCKQHGKITKRFKRHLKRAHDLTPYAHEKLPRADGDDDETAYCPLFPCCSTKKHYKHLKQHLMRFHKLDPAE